MLSPTQCSGLPKWVTREVVTSGGSAYSCHLVCFHLPPTRTPYFDLPSAWATKWFTFCLEASPKRVGISRSLKYVLHDVAVFIKKSQIDKALP